MGYATGAVLSGRQAVTSLAEWLVRGRWGELVSSAGKPWREDASCR